MAVQSATSVSVQVSAKSSHVEDASLQPFLQARFDPAEYLNTTLPALSFSNSAQNAQSTRTSLADLTAKTQSLMSQLNAQTSRLTTTLNQLTDEILRSGSRLAYEVEILRGETAGLSDALNEGLKEDISLFAPTSQSTAISQPASADASTPDPEVESIPPPQAKVESTVAEPEYIEKLRTLTAVRARLDSVIQTFGSAMQWPLAPSELASSSSFISVSAPTGSAEATRDMEEKGKEYIQKLRSEIAEMMETADSAEEGIEKAIARIEELKKLGEVWQGTAEEKGRSRVVEGLIKVVEDEQKTLAKKSEAKRRTASPGVGADLRYGDPKGEGRGGYGLFGGLKNLYVE